jgi:SET domain
MKSEFELGKSPHGIGVICLSPRRKNQRIDLWRAGDWKVWNPRTFVALKWCNKWCIYAWDNFYGPADPKRMSLAWYVNHSSAPNARCSYTKNGNWKFFALRNIKPGEEITVNYSTLDYYGK